MGNCQAAEAATVLIQHPDNKVERIYWSIKAQEVMSSNPGHYVAVVVTSPTAKAENGAPLKQLKLLRPHDTLLVGHVYRLICFEDVLKEFAEKKCVRLGKLVKEKGAVGVEKKKGSRGRGSFTNQEHDACHTATEVQQVGDRLGINVGGSSIRGVGRYHGGGGASHWKPALQSISEVGS
ncbi:hypothetical protein Ancab_025888 [Ancistrocladus abbreviatus]